ncbi:MAG: tetratricopeptide repeat protein [Acidobacteriota bacterium]|nr:tetratricopeptide repeat protein [Acidobacteriota bacterium]
MNEILDRGSLLFSSLSVIVLTVALRMGIPFYGPLLVLAVFYVPGLILMARVFGGLSGAFTTVFQRDYSSALTCTAMAWSAAILPLVLARWLAPGSLLPAIAVALGLYLVVLIFFAVRTAFGMGSWRAAGVVAVSWIPLASASYLWGTLRFIVGWLASPFFLFYAWYYLGGEIANLGEGLRRSQNFRRMLETSAVNPHDAGAQYQLGLIYQERRQYSEAIRRFTNAVAIRNDETDAHFQLGRIALQQGRLKDALSYFQTVLDQDPHHHQSEILREVGALYVDAGQYADAANELSVYAERRPYDPEGLYYCGRAFEGLGRMEEARLMYMRAIDAAKTAPRYLRRSVAKWSRFSQKLLKSSR